MAENSNIEWTDHTFNPWRGCTKVSPGCAHCYAETLSKRNPKQLGVWGPGQPRVLASEDMWRMPVKWNAEAVSYRVFRDGVWKAKIEDGNRVIIGRRDGMAGGSIADFEWRELPVWRPRVFCASLADWLDDDGVPIEWLARLLQLIYETPNLDWLLLTKRPQNWIKRITEAAQYLIQGGCENTCVFLLDWLNGNAPANIWLGTTVEDQIRADERIPQLLKIPAKVRFLSCEPLLGLVNIDFALFRSAESKVCPRCLYFTNRVADTRCPNDGTVLGPDLSVTWVICGGESGPKARPMHPDWARSLRDQCVEAGVPFFFKQWGEWCPGHNSQKAMVTMSPGVIMTRFGKVASGRRLDGREWSEFPGQKGGQQP